MTPEEIRHDDIMRSIRYLDPDPGQTTATADDIPVSLALGDYRELLQQLDTMAKANRQLSGEVIYQRAVARNRARSVGAWQFLALAHGVIGFILGILFR